ncbi:hypothetical protein GCM10010232_70110 [Streptomyces amakusaensis]
MFTEGYCHAVTVAVSWWPGIAVAPGVTLPVPPWNHGPWAPFGRLVERDTDPPGSARLRF